MVGVFMAFLDNTIVSIAFPNLLQSFPHSTIASLSWVFNIYNIALAALLVPAGRLADLLGRRRLFAAGTLLFTFASALCAAAPSIAFLIAARALQGIGAAIIVPSSLALVLHAYPQRQRAQGVALWSATAALAAGIGPSIGGLLVVLSSWRLVFLINLPLGALGWWLARHALVESRAPGRRVLPDLGGALLLAVAIGLLALAIVQGQDWGWLGVRTFAALLGSLAAGVWLARRSRTQPAPIIDRELLRAPGFAVTSALTVVGAAGFYGLGLANILYLMQVWRYSPLTAGLAGTPAPFLAALAAGMAGWLAVKRDARPLIVFGAALWTAGPLILIARFSYFPHYLTNYLPAAVVLALGIGIAFPLVSNIAVSQAPDGRYAGATALNSSIRQVGAVLGVAILAAIVGHPARSGVHAAFHRAWLFATICFGAVAVGALALRHARPAVHGADFAGAVRDMIVRPRAAAETRPRPTRPSRVFSLPAAVKPAVLGQSTEDFIAAVPLFAGLSASERSALARQATTVALPAGEWLFRQGDLAEAMFVVRTGRLEVVGERPDGSEVVLRELRAGAPLGELALIRRSRRTASVRVRRDVELLRLDSAQFEAILASSTHVARSLLGTLGDWLSGNHGPSSERPKPPATIAVLSLDPAAAQHRIETILYEEPSGASRRRSSFRARRRRALEPRPAIHWRRSSTARSAGTTT